MVVVVKAGKKEQAEKWAKKFAYEANQNRKLLQRLYCTLCDHIRKSLANKERRRRRRNPERNNTGNRFQFLTTEQVNLDIESCGSLSDCVCVVGRQQFQKKKKNSSGIYNNNDDDYCNFVYRVCVCVSTFSPSLIFITKVHRRKKEGGRKNSGSSLFAEFGAAKRFYYLS